jgi:hypothetical protein
MPGQSRDARLQLLETLPRPGKLQGHGQAKPQQGECRGFSVWRLVSGEAANLRYQDLNN